LSIRYGSSRSAEGDRWDAAGLHRVVPSNGGLVTGPLPSGWVLPGGADVQVIPTPAETVAEARRVLESLLPCRRNGGTCAPWCRPARRAGNSRRVLRLGGP